MRGDTTVTIDGKDYDLVVNMDALRGISKAMGASTFGESVQAILGAEPNAIAALLAIRENSELREAVTKGVHYVTIGEKAATAIVELMGTDEGNGDGAEQTPRKKP